MQTTILESLMRRFAAISPNVIRLSAALAVAACLLTPLNLRAAQKFVGADAESFLRKHIEKKGPISVAEFMHIALAHPKYGYYMSRLPFGKSADLHHTEH